MYGYDMFFEHAGNKRRHPGPPSRRPTQPKGGASPSPNTRKSTSSSDSASKGTNHQVTTPSLSSDNGSQQSSQTADVDRPTKRQKVLDDSKTSSSPETNATHAAAVSAPIPPKVNDIKGIAVDTTANKDDSTSVKITTSITKVQSPKSDSRSKDESADSKAQSPFVDPLPGAERRPPGQPTMGELNELLLSLSRQVRVHCQVA